MVTPRAPHSIVSLQFRYTKSYYLSLLAAYSESPLTLVGRRMPKSTHKCAASPLPQATYKEHKDSDNLSAYVKLKALCLDILMGS